MVKLNYSKRRSDGTKLGEIVVKDLKKKTTLFLAKPETERSSASLELALPGRKLEDDGLKILVDELLTSLTSDSGPPCFRLEELNLAENNLTVDVLPLIAVIINHSSSSLKVLSLSSNDFHIDSDEAAKTWEHFLNAFEDCTELQILDLSENDFSDIRALEVLDRVYARHPIIDSHNLVPPEDDSLVSTPVSEKSSSKGKASDSSPSSPVTEQNGSLTNEEVTEIRVGLRSIPYIVLANCGITDAGALCLSYILACHYYPHQLTTQLKSILVTLPGSESKVETVCSGIVYLPNEKMSENGIKLLSMAEDVRTEWTVPSPKIEDYDDGSNDWSPPVRSQGSASRQSLSAMSAYHRRSSLWSIGSLRSSHSDEYTQNAASLDSFRRKIQRQLLENGQSLEIWRVSLKLIALSRLVFIVPREPETDSLPEFLSDPKYRFAIFGLWARSLYLAMIGRYLPIPFTCADEINGPRRPYIVGGEVVPEETEADFENAAASEKAWVFRSKLGESSRKRLDKPYLERKTVGCLPRFLWKRIFEVALASEDKLGVAQFDRMVEWGRRRQTLGWEMEMGGKGRAVRVLSILERIQGVMYDFFL